MSFKAAFLQDSPKPETAVNTMEYHSGTPKAMQKCFIPVNHSQPPPQEKVPDITTKPPALFHDPTKGTRTDNHLMLRREEMKVHIHFIELKVVLMNIRSRITLFPVEPRASFLGI